MSFFQNIKLWQSWDGKVKATNEFGLPNDDSSNAPEVGPGAKRWNPTIAKEQTYNGTTWVNTGEGTADDDEDVTISSANAGHTTFNYPSLAGVRFRLIRDGIYLNSSQFIPLDTGGWELISAGDILTEGSVYTIVRY